MAGDAIIAEELTYHYGQLVAVDHISFKVAEGEILGFLGPLQAVQQHALPQPREGQAIVLGIDVARDPEKVQAHIGVCFETTNLYEKMSAAENLKLFARLFGVLHFDAASLLERVGLAGRERDRVEEYSKGMKQRLMVARALVNRPSILFLDEPTDGLDPASAENIRKVILEERERGATVFLTTHDMMEADKLSDRVGFINQGKIVALDTPHNLKQQYGKRALRAQVAGPGGLESREIIMDMPETAGAIQELFGREKVVTIHSEEASLEDIFIDITGRGLTE